LDSDCSKIDRDKIISHSACNFPYITYPFFDKYPELFAFTSLRTPDGCDGESNSPDNIIPKLIPLIVSEINIPSLFFVAGRQVHSINIATIDSKLRNEPSEDNLLIIPETDGLITNKRGVALCVLTADCLPVFLYDCVENVIALIHAGRRGTENGICSIAVSRMIESYKCNPENIIALFGASIGPCCYPIDLWKANKEQLEKQNLSEICIPRICTGCNTDIFYSYRVEKGKTGRMISVIVLK